MKINKKELVSFIKELRRRTDKPLTDKELVRHLAIFMETHPSSIDLYGTSKKNRFGYETVGYGVFSLLGVKYRLGRIEVFDRQSDSGYQIHEGTYCMPHQAAASFENFIESLNTSLPIQLSLGSIKWCEEECAKALGLSEVSDLYEQSNIDAHRAKQLAKFTRKYKILPAPPEKTPV